jgi:pyruvate dehydrogenase (quinone)
MEQTQSSETVSDFLVRRLAAWKVQRIFGYAGDGINGILGALNRAGNRPEFVPAAHEELAALMACAHAKFTGEVGVCLATQGPGAIHLLNGLYDANLDHQPVVAIVGQPSQMSMGASFQQEIDLVALYKDVAGAYCQLLTDPAQVRHVIDRAFRIAHAERTVTCVIVPHDLQHMDAVAEPGQEHGAMHSAIGYAAPSIVPSAASLQRAADVLNASSKLAILVGAGALKAGGQVSQVAERRGAGVAKALLGKAALPDDLPFVTGTVGWLGTSASNEMMKACDALLIVGSGFPYTEFLPKEGQARGVQIDIEERALGLRYPTEVNLVGDSATTLAQLLPLLKQNEDSAWRRQIENWKSEWQQKAREWALQETPALNPQRVFFELSPKLPANCVLAGDCGSSTVWYARYLQIQSGMQASLSGTLATMGSALPYAMAAKCAYPDRPVIAVVGDGAMQMNGISQLISIAAHWREWADPRLVILVLNNRDLNYVTWEQRVMEGEPKFPISQNVPDFPYARYAELLGLEGIRMAQGDDIAGAWDEALAADRPVVVEAITEPSVPAVPPKLKPEQREKLERALSAGDPDASAVRSIMEKQGLLG